MTLPDSPCIPEMSVEELERKEEREVTNRPLAAECRRRTGMRIDRLERLVKDLYDDNLRLRARLVTVAPQMSLEPLFLSSSFQRAGLPFHDYRPIQPRPPHAPLDLTTTTSHEPPELLDGDELDLEDIEDLLDVLLEQLAHQQATNEEVNLDSLRH